MDLKQLKCFVFAAEAGNFTRASQRLHIAQSALSRHISNLEMELGVKLFSRSGRGVDLTSAGISAFEKAKKLLYEVELFLGEVFADPPEEKAQSIILGSLGSLGYSLIPGVINRLRDECRKTYVRVIEDFSEQIEERISSGSVDVGLVIGVPGHFVLNGEIKATPLFEDDIYVAMSAQEHSRIGDELPLDVGMKLPLVLAPTGSRERIGTESWAKRVGLALNVVGEATSFRMQIALARSFDAGLLMPGSGLVSLTEHGSWKIHKLTHELYGRFVWFIVHRRNDTRPLVERTIELIRKQAETLCASRDTMLATACARSRRAVTRSAA